MHNVSTSSTSNRTDLRVVVTTSQKCRSARWSFGVYTASMVPGFMYTAPLNMKFDDGGTTVEKQESRHEACRLETVAACLVQHMRVS
jgi:hypothetical protein